MYISRYLFCFCSFFYSFQLWHCWALVFDLKIIGFEMFSLLGCISIIEGLLNSYERSCSFYI
jgi:hypothetical protein